MTKEFQESLSLFKDKVSDCLSCSNYKKESCANPGHAASGMLCFSWSSY